MGHRSKEPFPPFSPEFTETGKVWVIDKCDCCDYYVAIEVYLVALLDWKAGALAQDAFPELDPDDREFLISGICGTCFDAMFELDEKVEWF